MTLLSSFQNGRSDSFGRRFPGMQSPHPLQTWVLDPRQARRVDVKAGDTLSFIGVDRAGVVSLVAFDARGQDALGHIGITANALLDLDVFDSPEYTAWITAQGGDVAQAQIHSFAYEEPLLVLSATGDCTLWIINAATRDGLAQGGAGGAFQINLKPAHPSAVLLPEPLGDIREEFTIDRATAQAYQVRKGDYIQIIDVDGQQCSDFMALRTAGLDRGTEQMIDSTVTRTIVRGAFPGPGLFDKFYDSDMRPLLNVVQDTVGRHDTFALACTARGYEERGFPGHVNCSDNISDALDPYGVGRRSAWPAINFFFNSWITLGEEVIRSEESWSRPGDYVAMQAMDDLTCVSTACPDDIDPINGWNPTDVHVRIYKPDTPIRRAVAYREKENARMSISENSAFHPRTSALTQNFAPARNLWLPQVYPSLGTIGEYWKCRDAATLQDMSSLRKYDIIGPDAERLLNRCMTRDITRLAQWRGTYALMCDDQGAVIDDGTLFHIGPGLYRWCCGSEESGRHLAQNAEGLNVRIQDMQSALPNLAMQGPRSRDILRKIVFTQPNVPALDHVKWFGVTQARMHHREGPPFLLARSGYTGELGYELFCAASDAVAIWDAVMEAGAEFGIAPMGNDALDMIRIEAGLAAANAEFAPGVDAYEAGLGFAVDLRKPDFIGRAALERNAAHPRRALKGMLLDCDDVPSHGAHVYAGERPVGIVTSATKSPTLKRAIAMVRVAVEHSDVGSVLEIGQMDGHMKRLSGRICDIPFIDPKREKARA